MACWFNFIVSVSRDEQVLFSAVDERYQETYFYFEYCLSSTSC